MSTWSGAFAAIPDTSQWQCTLCPFPKGVQAETTVGVSLISDDAFRYGNGSGYDQQGGYADIGSEGRFPTEGLELSWQLKNLGVGSRSAEIGLKKPGQLDIVASYQDIPQRLLDTTTTVFNDRSDSLLSLPNTWSTSNLTTGFTDFSENLQPRSIESDRSVYGLKFRYLPSAKISLFTDFRRRDQQGVGVLSGANFTNAALLPYAIDNTTNEIDLGIRINNERGYVSAAAYGSVYSNANTLLEWDNPFSAFPGAERGRLAQAPDNSFIQLSVKGGLSFGNTTHLSAAAAVGRMAQDESLLPYTSNQTLIPETLPISKLDAEVDTTNVSLAIRSRPWSKIDLDIRYRFDDRDNQTRQETWSRVIVDSLPSGASETNSPYSFRRSRFSGRVRANLFPTLKTSAGYEHIRTDRDLQEVAEQKENTGWASIDWNPLTLLDIKLKAGTAKREVDRYNTLVANSRRQNPLLRKFNLAHRYRKFGEASLATSWPARAITLSTSLSFADDDYSQSELGLQNAEEWQLSTDLGWSWSANTQWYIGIGIEKYESDQSGSASFTTSDWVAVHDDQFTNYRIGLQMREVFAKTDLTIDYTHSAGKSEINVKSRRAQQSAFPDLTSDLHDVTAKLTHRRTNRLDWVAEMRYQRFVTKDWAIDGVGPQTIPSILTLGASPYNYSVFQFGVSIRYRISN